MKFLDISNREEYYLWELANTNTTPNPISLSVRVRAEGLPKSKLSEEHAIDEWMRKNAEWFIAVVKHSSHITGGRIKLHFGGYTWNIYFWEPTYSKFLHYFEGA